MAGTGRRGILMVSIDLETTNGRGAAESLTGRLIDLAQKHQIPITWAIADPGNSRSPQSICDTAIRHEIAISGDPTWVGEKAGRTKFSRELSQRVESARHAGINTTTLSLRDTTLTDHLDLLVKHHISVVRDVESDKPHSAQTFRPGSLRFGVWQAPPSCDCLGEKRWWQLSTVQVARRAINRAIATGEIAHLIFDADRLSQNVDAGLRAIDRMLHYARRACDEGRLVAKTLRSLAVTEQKHRTAASSRSIMRPAA